ncbi:MAG: MamI family restriction endonuclease [Muribaculaceae bacterium]|nr:MamI family restriction endonuclease [Muribaculaceae bacterium]
MKPLQEKITIDDNLNKIKDFIQEIIINPRHTLKKWSELTRQTPSIKLGYIGQHLASLITGIQGSGSGARGDDLCDGTEVKSCNKIDQLDKCKDCGSRVLRYEERCLSCGSSNIDRRNDSKWLFSIRSEHELKQYENLDRILLILTDYPDFSNNVFTDVRISAFEIYPKNKKCNVFIKLINNHFHNIYTPKIKKKKKANPMNLHPFSFQFYKCNPTLVFECIIKNIEDAAKCKIIVTHYFEPNQDRTGSMLMPTHLLKPKEWCALNYKKIKDIYKIKLTKKEFLKLSIDKKVELVPEISEELREDLPLRDIISKDHPSQYQR